MRYLLYLLAIFCLLVNTKSFAQKFITPLPITADGVELVNHKILLGSDGQQVGAQLYLFCNQTDQAVTLMRTDFSSPGVQAGWDSQLAGRTCSVLMLNQAIMVFGCANLSTQPLAWIDCANTVAVAKLGITPSDLQLKSIGNYWVLESKPAGQLKDLLEN